MVANKVDNWLMPPLTMSQTLTSIQPSSPPDTDAVQEENNGATLSNPDRPTMMGWKEDDTDDL